MTDSIKQWIAEHEAGEITLAELFERIFSQVIRFPEFRESTLALLMGHHDPGIQDLASMLRRAIARSLPR